jgi:class 3 adenylate cyclase
MHNLVRISGVYFKKKNYDTAIYLLKKVNTYFESIGEKRISSESLGMMADIYLIKSENDPKSKYLDSAQICADLSLQKCLEIEYQIQLLKCYNLNYSINKKKGISKKAMDYLEKYVTINDILYGKNARSKLVGIAIKQRDEIAVAQLKLKDAQVLRQRIYSYAALAGIGLTALLLFFVYRNSKNQKKSTAIIIKEKQRSEELLLNILPSEMVEELKANGTTKAKAFTMVTVMFTDFKDFTTVSEKVSAELLVAEIHHCFSTFDRIIQKYKIEKIKTIGDSYMCASGLPVSNYTHAKDMVNAAFEIRNFMLERKKEKEANDEIPFELRIGIHTGPVVAGIVGIKKFAYDIWGDTVNLAARMEQNCDAGKINISGSTYELVKEKFKCEHRGKIQAKNKGEIDMYFVEEIHSMVRSSDKTDLAKVDSSAVN